MSSVAQRAEQLWSDFVPHFWLRTGHAQTIFAAWHAAKGIPYLAQQHVIPTTEGDQLVLHDDCPADWSPGSPCVLLIHGLGGSHQSPYMVRIAHKLRERHLRVFRLDMRGCGAGFRLARKPGHAGRSEDVGASLERIQQLCPDAPLDLVGFSLGGNVLLKALGEWESNPPPVVRKALAVAPPIDLVACSRNIERRRMFLYNRWFVRCLVQQVALRRSFVPEIAELEPLGRLRTLYEFDDRVTAPLSGFRGAEHYYAESSAKHRLGAIRVPTTIVSALDDPIVPAFIYDDVRPTESLGIELCRGGGHMGFFAAPSADRRDWYWLDDRVVRWVLSPP